MKTVSKTYHIFCSHLGRVPRMHMGHYDKEMHGLMLDGEGRVFPVSTFLNMCAQEKVRISYKAGAIYLSDNKPVLPINLYLKVRWFR